MSWVEVDGAGWRWVHGLVIPLYVNHDIKTRSLNEHCLQELREKLKEVRKSSLTIFFINNDNQYIL